MYACHIVCSIIRIMNINRIRSAFLQTVCIISCNWHIIWKQIPFIMHFPKTSIRIFIIIRNRYHICVAFRICIRCFPDTFQAVPHACLIRQEYDFFLILREHIEKLTMEADQKLSHFLCQLPAFLRIVQTLADLI